MYKDNLITQRELFKRAVKVLPIFALASFPSIRIEAKAVNDCEDYCANSCKNGCMATCFQGCHTKCAQSCVVTCRTMCGHDSCCNGCRTHCSDGCTKGCGASCYGGCSGTASANNNKDTNFYYKGFNKMTKKLVGRGSMRKVAIFVLFCLSYLSCFAHENILLETSSRMIVDTTIFMSTGEPSIMLLIQHPNRNRRSSQYKYQKALATDQETIRKDFGIPLYVVYPANNDTNKKDFLSYNPVNSAILFLLQSPEGFCGYVRNDIFTILFDGKGNYWTYAGDNYDDIVGLIGSHIDDIKCPTCMGTKVVFCSHCKAGFKYCSYCSEGIETCGFCKNGYKDCIHCKGKGYLTCIHCINGMSSCPKCTGGKIIIPQKPPLKPTEKSCEHCNGTGKVKCIHCHGNFRKKCEYCHGQKEVLCSYCDGNYSKKCGHCGGEYKTICKVCHGDFQCTCKTCKGLGRISRRLYIDKH